MEEDLDSALSQSRRMNQNLIPPIDNDATRAIPIIKEPFSVSEWFQKQNNDKHRQPRATKDHQQPVKKNRKRKIIAIIAASLIILLYFSDFRI